MLCSLLTWAALRFGMPGVTLALATLAVIMSTSDAVDIGPLLWGGDSQPDRLLEAQLVLVVISTTWFLLAISYSEVEVAEQSSRQEQARLRALGDNLPDGMVYQVVREKDGKCDFFTLVPESSA
jgi:integral membrane sensor domain MASE1